jgi:hypothetical protein
MRGFVRLVRLILGHRESSFHECNAITATIRRHQAALTCWFDGFVPVLSSSVPILNP